LYKHSFSLFALAAVFLLGEPARADYLFTFPGASTGLLGTEHDFTSGPATIKSYGLVSSLSGSTLTLGAATNLYGKTGGGDETGLGVANDPSGDNEITTKSTIKLDLSAFFATHPILPVTISIGSVQNGEGFAIFGGSASPTTELYHLTGNSGQSIYAFTATASQVSSSGGVFYVTATSNNVLLDTVSLASVPEPGSITLALTGLGTLAVLAWHRRRKTA
jgi:PEP-CTERM motif